MKASCSLDGREMAGAGTPSVAPARRWVPPGALYREWRLQRSWYLAAWLAISLPGLAAVFGASVLKAFSLLLPATALGPHLVQDYVRWYASANLNDSRLFGLMWLAGLALGVGVAWRDVAHGGLVQALQGPLRRRDLLRAKFVLGCLALIAGLFAMPLLLSLACAPALGWGVVGRVAWVSLVAAPPLCGLFLTSLAVACAVGNPLLAGVGTYVVAVVPRLAAGAVRVLSAPSSLVQPHPEPYPQWVVAVSATLRSLSPLSPAPAWGGHGWSSLAYLAWFCLWAAIWWRIALYGWDRVPVERLGYTARFSWVWPAWFAWVAFIVADLAARVLAPQGALARFLAWFVLVFGAVWLTLTAFLAPGPGAEDPEGGMAMNTVYPSEGDSTTQVVPAVPVPLGEGGQPPSAATGGLPGTGSGDARRPPIAAAVLWRLWRTLRWEALAAWLIMLFVLANDVVLALTRSSAGTGVQSQLVWGVLLPHLWNVQIARLHPPADTARYLSILHITGQMSVSVTVFVVAAGFGVVTAVKDRHRGGLLFTLMGPVPRRVVWGWSAGLAVAVPLAGVTAKGVGLLAVDAIARWPLPPSQVCLWWATNAVFASAMAALGFWAGTGVAREVPAFFGTMVLAGLPALAGQILKGLAATDTSGIRYVGGTWVSGPQPAPPGGAATVLEPVANLVTRLAPLAHVSPTIGTSLQGPLPKEIGLDTGNVFTLGLALWFLLCAAGCLWLSWRTFARIPAERFPELVASHRWAVTWIWICSALVAFVVAQIVRLEGWLYALVYFPAWLVAALGLHVVLAAAGRLHRNGADRGRWPGRRGMG
ncbi:MAG: hypothetical protein IRZ33_02710 [Alicyclobacillaceae bacterium]|nr:hypothetical protein [Alicyclobacillaceae bacterium]